MKILQTYKKALSIAFVQTEWTKNSFQGILPLLLLFVWNVFVFCYLIFENGTFQENSEIIYVVITVGMNTLNGGIIYTKRSKISAFIEKVEKKH